MTNEKCPWAFPIFGIIIIAIFAFAMVNLWIYETKNRNR